MLNDIKNFLKSLPTYPGIYQMFGKSPSCSELLYVGKAKNLKKRISSYFRSGLDPKTQALVQKIDHIEITITNSEAEALLLENNLIKAHHPKYNILFRDDKSYPYIVLTNDKFPAIYYFRGKQKKDWSYFGPYPDCHAAKETVQIIQQLFLIRGCKNTFFSTRRRPCLNYQIKRCSAPCVNSIAFEEYEKLIDCVRMFLEGKNSELINYFTDLMKQYVKQLKFEDAALIRDKIQRLQEMQFQQHIDTQSGDIDVVSVSVKSQIICIVVLFVRAGKVLGKKIFTKTIPFEYITQNDLKELIESFLLQYYLDDLAIAPKRVVVDCQFDSNIIENILKEKLGVKTKFSCKSKAKREKEWLKLAKINANESMRLYFEKHAKLQNQIDGLKKLIGIDFIDQIECFDISHIMGNYAVASCVVFNAFGPVKKQYRYFNIEGITPGDDYSAMEQALKRRFSNYKSHSNLVIIDGGIGQLMRAKQVFSTLNIRDITLISIAKGSMRNHKNETIFFGDENVKSIVLEDNSTILHLIQRIRDEAHRFAISKYREKHKKNLKNSILDGISGLGPKKKELILKQFGGLTGIKKATLEELQEIKGINANLAKKIYDVICL